ncbi:MFS transporter [Cohnella sp. LGH]|uniref:PPP family 3-phenylpropionic acid transporter n=1 Tax=Cohnella phaseoli TaxID=456490 RepID=A0A3D9I4H3_9BACL|nr:MULTISPECIES: MFS transporter [Cohnella]QTH42442.1 MFS transporter [Cohnella sp. LGH]RED56683.1 PPP family 3-phenylpropionic acid transporter [Cohnella phaseoli]
MTERPAYSFNILRVFNFVMYGALAVYGTFFSLYLKDIGISPIEIGTLLAGGPIVSLVANPLWAYWADRMRNNRIVLILALIGAFATMQVVFSTGNEPLIYGAILVYFIFQSPLFTQSNSLILNTIEGTRHKFGAFRMWGSLGWAVTAAASGPLIGHLGIHKLWVVFDVAMLVAIAIAFLLPRGSEMQNAGSSNKTSYAQIFANRPFLMLLGIGVLVSVPNSINGTFVGLYIDQLGGSASVVGWSMFATAFLEAPVFLLMDKYMKRSVKPMVGWLVIASLLYTIRWALMGTADTALQIVAIQLMHCATFGIYYYVGTQLTSLFVPAEYRSSGQAIYGLTWGGVSGILAGTVGGWMFQELGPQEMYRISAGVTLMGTIAFCAMLRMVSRRRFDRLPEGNNSGA